MRGNPTPAATRSGVEWTVVLGFLCIRAFDLAQGVVALATGSLSRSTNPALSLAAFIAVSVESLLLVWWLVRRRSVIPARWPVAADFALALLALGSVSISVAPDARISLWTMWAYPVTLSTAVLAGGVLTRWQHALAASGVLALAYLAVVVLPLPDDPATLATAVVNAMGYPGFAMVAYVFTRFVRGLADLADEARARVAELERDRSRAIVHDLLPYLRLDRFAEADEKTRLAMVDRAQATYAQMRSYVDGSANSNDVEASVRAVLELHRGTKVRTVFDVERGTDLPDDVLEHLRRALDTALSNVEQHANGAAAVVRVRSRPDHVEVTVHDDGPGFDPALTTPGFGIAEILGRQLRAVGGEGRVTSAPGSGTEVHITVPRRGLS